MKEFQENFLRVHGDIEHVKALPSYHRAEAFYDNENIQPHHEKEFLGETDEDVVAYLARTAQDPEVQNALSSHANNYVRFNLSKNPRLNWEVVKKLSNDPDEQVKRQPLEVMRIMKGFQEVDK